MLYLLFSAIVGVLPIAPKPAETSLPYWALDYQSAQETAKAEHKPVLLAFLGGETCPWSTKIRDELLFNPDFGGLLKEKFQLVLITCPEPNALAESFNVAELPTFLLLDSQGEEVSRISYLNLTAHEFADHLTGVWKGYEDLTRQLAAKVAAERTEEELSQLYSKAETIGARKIQSNILDAGLKISKGLFFPLEKYTAFVKEGKRKSKEAKALRERLLSLDTENKDGVHLSVALLDFYSSCDLPRRPKDIVKPLTSYLEKFGNKDPKNRWRVEWIIAQFFFSKEDLSRALRYAENSLAHAPEESKNDLESSIAYIKSQIK